VAPAAVRFFVGLHQPSDARRVDRPCMVSVNRLRDRRAPWFEGEWVMDSGAFTAVAKNGGYDRPPADYAREVRRWADTLLVWAASQDFMCEPFVLARTGLTVAEHQRLTVERYDALLDCDTGDVPILPVLQGYWPEDYRRHVAMYGERLKACAWVGVGSVCKRNSADWEVARVLQEIKRERPDLRLHGFGLKRTALASGWVRHMLYSADSMAWSCAARLQGRNGNDWREARAFADALGGWTPASLPLFGDAA
jgi:hypothetical protein